MFKCSASISKKGIASGHEQHFIDLHPLKNVWPIKLSHPAEGGTGSGSSSRYNFHFHSLLLLCLLYLNATDVYLHVLAMLPCMNVSG